jgi:hypothetical protein
VSGCLKTWNFFASDKSVRQRQGKQMYQRELSTGFCLQYGAFARNFQYFPGFPVTGKFFPDNEKHFPVISSGNQDGLNDPQSGNLL